MLSLIAAEDVAEELVEVATDEVEAAVEAEDAAVLLDAAAAVAVLPSIASDSEICLSPFKSRVEKTLAKVASLEIVPNFDTSSLSCTVPLPSVSI